MPAKIQGNRCPARSLEKGHPRTGVIFTICPVHSRTAQQAFSLRSLIIPILQMDNRSEKERWCAAFLHFRIHRNKQALFTHWNHLKKKKKNQQLLPDSKGRFQSVIIFHQKTWHLPWLPQRFKWRTYFFLLSGITQLETSNGRYS